MISNVTGKAAIPRSTSKRLKVVAPVDHSIASAPYNATRKRTKDTVAISESLREAGYHDFARALSESGLDKLLDGGKPYTIFAPTDAAFSKLLPAARARLTNDISLLRGVVGYHFAAGKVLAGRFAGKRIRALTYSGQALIIEGKKGLRINAAKLTQPDIILGPSVIHGIDGVLWPREPSLGAA